MSTVNYRLFELLQREHKLTLLESELQEIIDVCRQIEADTSTPPANLEDWRTALANLISFCESKLSVTDLPWGANDTGHVLVKARNVLEAIPAREEAPATPTPLASTAMAAADLIDVRKFAETERDLYANNLGYKKYWQGYIDGLDKSASHFQPLLAKVEGEETFHTGYAPVSLVRELQSELTALRADLAAEETALTQIFKWWDAHDGHLTTAFSHSVDRKMESFRSALTSRADKGGAR